MVYKFKAYGRKRKKGGKQVMFEKFENRVIISGILETKTGLHIGSAYAHGSADTDSPVIKDVDEKPIIPGSSFKGVLRSVVEKIVSGLGLDCCYITNQEGNCLSANNELKQKEFEEAKKAFTNPGEEEEYMESLICDVCKLFGSTYISSRVFIKDLRYKEGNANYSVRDGVAIDRDSETAGDKLKYDFEVVPPNVKFEFEAIAENISLRLLGLLFIGLKQFESPNSVIIGGMKSRGLGWVNLKLNQIEVVDSKGDLLNEEDAKLKSYLINNRGHIISEETGIQAFINKAVRSFLS